MFKKRILPLVIPPLMLSSAIQAGMLGDIGTMGVITGESQRQGPMGIPFKPAGTDDAWRAIQAMLISQRLKLEREETPAPEMYDLPEGSPGKRTSEKDDDPEARITKGLDRIIPDEDDDEDDSQDLLSEDDTAFVRLWDTDLMTPEIPGNTTNYTSTVVINQLMDNDSKNQDSGGKGSSDKKDESEDKEEDNKENNDEEGGGEASNQAGQNPARPTNFHEVVAIAQNRIKERQRELKLEQQRKAEEERESTAAFTNIVAQALVTTIDERLAQAAANRGEENPGDEADNPQDNSPEERERREPTQEQKKSFLMNLLLGDGSAASPDGQIDKEAENHPDEEAEAAAEELPSIPFEDLIRIFVEVVNELMPSVAEVQEIPGLVQAISELKVHHLSDPNFSIERALSGSIMLVMAFLQRQQAAQDVPAITLEIVIRFNRDFIDNPVTGQPSAPLGLMMDNATRALLLQYLRHSGLATGDVPEGADPEALLFPESNFMQHLPPGNYVFKAYRMALMVRRNDDHTTSFLFYHMGLGQYLETNNVQGAEAFFASLVATSGKAYDGRASYLSPSPIDEAVFGPVGNPFHLQQPQQLPQPQQVPPVHQQDDDIDEATGQS